MKTPAIVSAQEWETAHRAMLVEEKALTRARDALAAKRRRMPWTVPRTAQNATDGCMSSQPPLR
ncbi:CalU12 protein [Mycobacteroides abscessus]|nr:CalU12 protein [Mycobacteroides abscessus]